MQSHRRSTKVCTRCRRRKTKCDFKFPACSTCKSAKAVCLGYDPVTKKEVPRSLVRSLEDQIAQLEAQLLSFKETPQNQPYLLASKIAQSTILFGISPSRTLLSSTITSSLLFYPSCPPLAVVRDREYGYSQPSTAVLEAVGEKHYSRYSSKASVNLNSIPSSAIKRMIANYTDIHLPQYPSVEASWLEDVVEKIQRQNLGDTDSLLTYGIPEGSGLSHFEYFGLYIILAISSMTLTWRAEFQARSASEAFYASALKHLRKIVTTDEIQSLQVSLLLAHYAQTSPEKADNWACISNAVRIVLDLGLHKQCPDTLGKDQVNLRSRLFWMTYGMDRSLVSNLKLPLSFPEDSITTKFEFATDDSFGNSDVLGDSVERNTSANHIYLYRAMETEVHRVLHLEEDVGQFTTANIGLWLQDITARLNTWHDKSHKYARYRMLEFREVMYNHLLARMHRPTPRLRIRTFEDRQICLEVCKALIESYVEQDQQQRLFYPWHGVHILFEATVVTLDACWNSRNWLPLYEPAKLMLEKYLPECLQCMVNIGQRWNESTICANRLRTIYQKVADVFRADQTTLGVDMNHQPSIDELAIEEELNGLLFSYGPLTWNITFPVEWLLPGTETNGQVVDGLPFDTDFGQWDLDWEFMP